MGIEGLFLIKMWIKFSVIVFPKQQERVQFATQLPTLLLQDDYMM